jgi:hypothetical protein
MDATVTWVAGGHEGDRPGGARPGVAVEVRRSRGRLATRQGRVLDVRVSGDVGVKTVIGVRWDDDGSVSWLVPGTDIEVSAS